MSRFREAVEEALEYIATMSGSESRALQELGFSGNSATYLYRLEQKLRAALSEAEPAEERCPHGYLPSQSPCRSPNEKAHPPQPVDVAGWIRNRADAMSNDATARWVLTDAADAWEREHPATPTGDGSTHWESCGLDGGPKHYECLVRVHRNLLSDIYDRPEPSMPSPRKQGRVEHCEHRTDVQCGQCCAGGKCSACGEDYTHRRES